MTLGQLSHPYVSDIHVALRLALVPEILHVSFIHNHSSNLDWAS